ncbi:MAG: hypothetical protein QXD11_00785 [Candidatus Micrarchaeaceae archaeon]
MAKRTTKEKLKARLPFINIDKMPSINATRVIRKGSKLINSAVNVMISSK